MFLTEHQNLRLCDDPSVWILVFNFGITLPQQVCQSQKFFPEDSTSKYPLLSDRKNIIIIADEAHRSQYGFKLKIPKNVDEAVLKYGYAKYVRDALPMNPHAKEYHAFPRKTVLDSVKSLSDFLRCKNSSDEVQRSIRHTQTIHQ